MFKTLRSLITSMPSIVAVGLVSAYLLLGFWILPAVLKWQLEKQVAQRGHGLQIDAIRFNPLRLELEVDRLALRDAGQQPMLGFEQLTVDMAWRSIVDGAWTFADVHVRKPQLRLQIDGDGRSNFHDLLERFQSAPASDDGATATVPAVRIRQLALSGGQIEWRDATLAQPLVTRIESFDVHLHGLSTLRSEQTQYRLSAVTDAKERIDLHGVFGIDPLLAQGTLVIRELAVATLARGLSRQLALQAPAGVVSLSGAFDLASDDTGALSGKVQALRLDLADLSLQAPGAKAPLLAAASVSLQGGEIDLARRDVRFSQWALRHGAVAITLDAKGQGDWTRMLRTASRSDAGTASAAPSSAAVQASAGAGDTAWHIAIAEVAVSDMALDMYDPSRQQSLALAALRFDAAPSLDVAASDIRLVLAKPRLQLSGLRFENGASALSLPSTRIDLAQASARMAGARLEGRLDGVQLALAQGMVLRQGDNTASLGASTLQSSAVTLGGGATLELTADKPQLQLATLAAARAEQSARLDRLKLSGDRLAWRARDAARLQWDRFGIELAGLQLQDTAQDVALDLAGLTGSGPSLALRQADTEMTVEAQAPDLRLQNLQARQASNTAAMDVLALGATSLDLTANGAGRLDLTLTGLRTLGERWAAARGADAAKLAQVMTGSASLNLAMDGDNMQLAGDSAQLTLKGVMLQQGGDTLALQDGELTLRTASVSRRHTQDAADAVADVQAQFDDGVLRLDALALARGQGAATFAQLAGANLSAGRLALGLSQAPLALRGDALALTLRGGSLRDPAVDGGAPLLQLGEATLADAAFSLSERSITIDHVLAQDAQADVWMDAQGRLNLQELFDRLAGATPSPVVAPSLPPDTAPAVVAPDPAAPGAWRVAVKNAVLQNAKAQFADRRRSPALAIGVDAIALQVDALDTASPTPMQVDLRGTLRTGGTVAARGAVHASSGAADLELIADGVALAPAQAFLSDYLELTLASGTASTQGRLVLGAGSDAAPRLRYAGGFSVEKVMLQENAVNRPFLSWNTVASQDLALTLGPDRLDIGELQLDGLDGRLIIAPDQSINLTDVLKKPRPTLPDDVAVSAGASATADAADKPVFPVEIARVRVTDGVLDFADLSLRPQFGTRMHQLKGVITGLSTDPERVAKVQLDARVDKFGSARIRGQASLLQPEKLTEIEMAFRNLEMTSLSPYVVKFAGYEIASGKLSLDLQYKVRNGKLLGQNKVVLNQMALGRKVESPDALDLPLELALAVLKDANGVIDVGLPVAGDLNDPKFDYGAVIGKAIGNLLGAIVTAPFRALAAIFGGGSKGEIDTIDFEPGSAALAPPEQQKIETVARALLARPQLQLRVAPVFAAREDRPVLQSLAVRSEIATRMGLRLGPDEDPGPVDVANPRVAQAVEAAFGARYAPAVLDLLKQRAMPVPEVSAAAPMPGAAATALPAAVPAGTPASASGSVGEGASRGARAAAPAAALPASFYQTLLDRMVAEQEVSDADLAALAQRRADGIAARLTTTDGVASGRVSVTAPLAATGATDTVVPLKLELDVAK